MRNMINIRFDIEPTKTQLWGSQKWRLKSRINTKRAPEIVFYYPRGLPRFCDSSELLPAKSEPESFWTITIIDALLGLPQWAIVSRNQTPFFKPNRPMYVSSVFESVFKGRASSQAYCHRCRLVILFNESIVYSTLSIGMLKRICWSESRAAKILKVIAERFPLLKKFILKLRYSLSTECDHKSCTVSHIRLSDREITMKEDVKR